MIGKISTGRGFGGTLDYDRDRDHRNGKVATLLEAVGVDIDYDADGNMAPDYRAIERSMHIQAQLNRRVRTPVIHIALSFHPDDKPRLTNEYLVSIAHDYLRGMGFTNTQFVIHRHEETDNPHIHIVLNKVRRDGKTLDTKYMLKRNMKVCKDITMREELTWGKSKILSESIPNDPAERLRYEMASAIHSCVGRITDIRELPGETIKDGIRTTLRLNEATGEPEGVTFTTLDGDGNLFSMKGSAIDRHLSAEQIRESLLREETPESRRPRLSEEEALLELRNVMAAEVRRCVSRITDIGKLPEETAKAGIETVFKYRSGTDEIQGISFTSHDANGDIRTLKGSAVDRKLSVGNILKNLGNPAFDTAPAQGAGQRQAEKEAAEKPSKAKRVEPREDERPRIRRGLRL